LPINGQADATYAGCKDMLRRTTGQIFITNSAAVSWASTLQPTGVQSTTEAEYMASAAAPKEALGHHKLRRELRLSTEGPKKFVG
jgi:hypothetical protein